MGKLRYKSGRTTVTLGGDLEASVRRAAERAAGPVLRHLEAEAQSLAAAAERQWYTQVKKRTGKSGQIEVVTTITDTSAIVSIGSTDTRTTQGGKPTVVFVRRPGVLSRVERAATPEEYHARRSSGMKPGEAYWVKVANPLASDGKFLLQELVRKPARVALKKALPKLGKLMGNS